MFIPKKDFVSPCSPRSLSLGVDAVMLRTGCALLKVQELNFPAFTRSHLSARAVCGQGPASDHLQASRIINPASMEDCLGGSELALGYACSCCISMPWNRVKQPARSSDNGL